MVHALTQAHQALVSHGLLLDLRPARDPGGCRAQPLDTFVVAGGLEIAAGAMANASYYADFAAADRAVERVVRQHLFTLHAAEIFPFRWYFRTLDVLEDTLAKDWTNTTLPAVVRQRLSTLLGAHPNAQIAVVESLRLNVLRKAGG